MTATENELRAGCEGGALILANDRALASLAKAMLAGVARLAGRDSTDRMFLTAALIGRLCLLAGDGFEPIERAQLLRLVRGAAAEALDAADPEVARRAYVAAWYQRNRDRVLADKRGQAKARTPEEAEAHRVRARAYYQANRETLLRKQRTNYARKHAGHASNNVDTDITKP
jgi:hypothetical protein